LLTLIPFAYGAIMLKAREAVLNLPTYHPPLGGRTGLRLDFNENTVGCSPRVLERLRRIDFEELARYPEREPVEAAVASHLGVTSDETLLTNGVDEAIHLLCEAYLEPGDEVFIAVPTFSMYEIFAAATGARVVSVPAAENFAFPTDALQKGIKPATRMIVVANPNNPTGAAASIGDLLHIAESAANAALLVDEAYFEFHGETLFREWRNRPNIFVARTFSKAYGLAGLRVGVLCGNREQMSAVRRVASPYNVNSVALACLPEALAEDAYVRQYVDEVCAGRERLESELGNLGIPYWPSRANFVLMRLGDLNGAFIRGMRARGILVRDRSRDYGCTGCVRITLGSTEQTEKMLGALHQTLHEIGAIRQEARS
jgi:histidinol-phosphate aminotransferase